MKASPPAKRSAWPCRASWWAVVAGFVLASGASASSVQASGLTGDTSAAPRCEVKVKLMGVVYNDKKPERSFAMVSYGRRRGTRMVYVGSRIAGKRVGAILPMAIWLGPAEAPCWVPLQHDSPQTKVRKRPKKKRKKRRRKR